MKRFGYVLAISLALGLTVANAQNKRGEPTAQPRQAKPVRLFNPATMAKPVSTYSQVAEVSGGKTIYIAGQVALDAEGALVGPNDLRAQVEQVFKNIEAAVTAAGGNMGSLVKVNYYVVESVEPSQLTAVREVRDKYINTAAPPTSTFVVVKRLVRPEYWIEVEAVAVVEK